MPPGANQGIDVGDAVFSFLGDTQNLDVALGRVDAIPERIAPAEASVADLSGSLQGLGTYFGQAGAEAEVASTEIVDASEKSAVAMREAKGEAALLGEEFGIHLPRHVRSFVAGLPGVGEALSAAFTATAVLFLIQALVEGTEKLTNWISNTFIMTEAMKASNNEIANENKLLIVQKELLNQATEAVAKFGIEGAALTQTKIEELSDSILKNQAALLSARDTLFDYSNGGLHATAEQAELAKGQILTLTASLKAQNEQLTLLQLQYQRQAFDEYVKFQIAKLNAQKTSGDSEIALTESQQLFRLAIIGGNYTQELQIRNKGEEALLKANISAIAARIQLLAGEGDKTKAERAQLYAEIEKLTNDHNAKVYASFAKVFETVSREAKELVPSIQQPFLEISDSITQSMDDASAAANKLGFTFTGDVYDALQKTKKAYDDLKATGRATYADLLQGQRAVLQGEIAYAHQFGQDTSAAQKALDKVNAEYAKLTGQVDHHKVRSHDYFTQFKLDLKQGADAMGSLATEGGQAFNELTQGIESAVASAILAQGSLGDALEKATAQALASLASQALVKALFYSAEGFAALAGFAYGPASQYFEAAGIMGAVGAAAGIAARGLSGGGSSAGGGVGSDRGAPADSSAATQAQSKPVSTINVQKLAGGGLLTKQTVAVLGDAAGGGDQQEAAIPLDDPRSLEAIVTAFHKAGMTGGGGTNIIFPHGTLVSPDNLKSVVKKINKMGDRGQVPVVSTNSRRLTKRSQ